jgi:hypothetical protein
MDTFTNDAASLENGDAPELPPQSVTPTESAQPQAVSGIGHSFVPLFLFFAFVLGLGSGYLLWGRTSISSGDTATTVSSGNQATTTASPSSPPVSPVNQISLPDSYTLPASFGTSGPQLLDAGAIDYDRFVQLYAEAGQPLTEQQLEILSKGSEAPVVIDRENAYFLLNFFWALGLTNRNTLLTEGPMKQYSQGDIGNFASTGGWTIGTKPAIELYASAPIITLTPEQQARLEEVAQAVYRPCCDNPTTFPDCNHGMAMLGLLELMAAQGATADEMFTAAKYVNAFWFPQQTLEMAVLYKASRGQDFAEVDARELVGPNISSGTGFQAVHQWLVTNKLLDQTPDRGSKCGV